MSGPDPAVSAVRGAVRRLLESARPDDGVVCVACSGGADSLALAAATVHCARRAGLDVHGLVVDHGLQDGSAEVAEVAARQLDELGCAVVRVLPVTVSGPGGPEGAARRARYAALLAARPGPDTMVLLGHTRDDQAETVLLGLGRGSGPRSIAGMRPLEPPWGRPLLELSRATTVAACAALGLRPWSDPHNLDPAFTRVRLRTEVLPLLEDVLHGGVAAALARTAAQVREDCDALDALAADLLERAADSGQHGRDSGQHAHENGQHGVRDGGGLAVGVLGEAHPAVRRRALRGWLLASGVSELTDAQLRAVDALVGVWRGQGGISLPGGLVAGRTHGRLHLDRSPQIEGKPGRV